MKIISVVGARPNFMKVAPIHKAFIQLGVRNDSKTQQVEELENKNLHGEKHAHINTQPLTINHLICHTGQHYDEKMSKVFFEELELPQPHFYLGVGSGSHAEQTAKVMIEFEKVLINELPDLVIVVGDVNSTIACSLTAVKLGIKVAHVEAGLRSFDRQMPEEINRILTDSIADYLFVTEKSGIENLIKEGIDSSKIFFVGNVMIDSLINYLPKIQTSQIFSKLNIEKGSYSLITLHRPSNVDDKDRLEELISLIEEVSKNQKVVFPIHPRTKNNLQKYDLLKYLNHNIITTDPLGYIDFISLIKHCNFVLTDSGGIQEETTYLGVPCVTLRNTTERPITVEVGTNYLVGEDFSQAKKYINRILAGNHKQGKIPELWDGKSAERIVKILIDELIQKHKN